MQAKTAQKRMRCTRCKHGFRSPSGSTRCQKCGHEYVEWLNFDDWAGVGPEELEAGDG